MKILDAFPKGTPVFGYPFFDDQLYAATGEAAGEPFGVGEISYSGKYLVHWMQRSGKWLIVDDIWNSDAPLPMAPAPASPPAARPRH